MSTPRAIVVGSGAGGVAVAARLAKNGIRVTVLEKNSYTGGRCSIVEDEDYRFDQGPSLLLMPEFFAEIFQDLETTMEREGVQLLRCDPNYRIWFPDRQSIDISSNMNQMNQEIQRFEGKQGFSAFLNFLNEAGEHYNLSCTHVLGRNFTSLCSMLRPGLLFSLWRLHPFESMYSRISRYFRSEKLRQAFTFASMYVGMSPFDAPGTFSLLQYTELAHGIWYPVGGLHAVLDALVKIGKRLGVEYRLNCPVTSVKLSDDGHMATGVCLASGETLDADLVIVNADLTYAYNNLLPGSTYGTSLQKRDTSCSCISFFWSFSTTIPELQSHNVFLAQEYRESFDRIFKENKVPLEPSFYVHVPSRLDKTAAPEGKDAVVVLVPVGHLPQGTNNEETDERNMRMVDYLEKTVSKLREQVLDIIEERTGASNLRKKLLSEKVDTPLSWESKYNLDRGSILGLSHSFFNVLSFRPKTRHSSIERLFFVGASTHPGTGVPICLASSKIVAEQALRSIDAKRKRDVEKRPVHVLLFGFTLAISVTLALAPVSDYCQFVADSVQLHFKSAEYVLTPAD